MHSLPLFVLWPIKTIILTFSTCLNKIAIEDVSGTWWWKDEIPLNQGHVKLETREGKGGQDKYLHDIRCDWGAIDSYAAKFRRGKIFKYELNNQGLPLKLKECGTFSIKVSPHRPLVGKDFLSFE